MTAAAGQPSKTYGAVLFPSVRHAMQAESLVQVAGLPCKLIPMPPQLSSECGVVLRFDWEDREKVLAVLQEASLETGETRLLQ